MSDPDAMIVFDRAAVRRNRDRAAPRFAEHAFLFEEAAERLTDRLDDVRRRFARVLDLGCHDGTAARRLADRPGVEQLVACDLAPALVAQAPGLRVCADEEALPFAEASFDLAVSVLSLHWVNDLPGALVQLRRCLRPDGLFLGAMLGGETLFELRRCLIEAELEISGGVSARLSPFAELRDAAGLLHRAGFALPVADCDTLTVTYADAFRLMADLRGMGEVNAGLNRLRHASRRAVFIRAAERYQALFSEPDGRVPATFQILWLSGWAPHASQPQPLARGTAQHRLAEALRPSGEAAGP